MFRAFCVGFISFFLLCTGCAQREIKNLDSRGSSIVCLGDSVTYGYGAERGEDYPSALKKFVSVPVINAGVDSDTTAKGLVRIESSVLDKKPFLVIVEFGANDFLEKVPREDTLANMKEIVRRIQEHGAMVAIVDISAGMLFNEYRAAFQKIAKETGSLFIPNILSGIITNPGLKSDFVHPNAKGYSLIAQRIFLGIRPYLVMNRRGAAR